MTSVAPATETVPLARRLGNVVRLHLANPWQPLITPWIIFGAIFGLNLAIWYTVTVAAGGRDKLDSHAFSGNGGAWWILVFLLVVAVQAMNLTFRFALGMGFTRRDYYLGSVIFFALLAMLFATGITVLAAIEHATDGWGVQGRFFSPWWGAGFPVFTVWFIKLFFSFAANRDRNRQQLTGFIQPI